MRRGEERFTPLESFSSFSFSGFDSSFFPPSVAGAPYMRGREKAARCPFFLGCLPLFHFPLQAAGSSFLTSWKTFLVEGGFAERKVPRRRLVLSCSLCSTF